MAPYQDVILFLDKVGLWDIVLPFILVFTLVYATLDRTKVLGTEGGMPKRRINAMVAFVISFFVLVSAEVLGVINIIAQYLVIFVIAVMCLSVLLGLMGFKGVNKRISYIFALVIVGAISLYALGYMGILSLPALRKFFEGPIIALFVLILIVWLIMRQGSGEKAPEKEKGQKKEEKPEKEEEQEGEEGGPEEEMPEEYREPSANKPVQWRLKESIPKEELKKRGKFR